MNLNIDYLLENLTADTLRKIHEDELLTKREGPYGLVIANASKKLWTPQEEHQLYAKGIVYNPHTWELASLPLIKIYNHGEKEESIKLSKELDKSPAVSVKMMEKADGTMIQAFKYNGDLIVTTRGMFDSEYTQAAREILENTEIEDHATLIFELIHPDFKHVVDYGDRKELRLLAVHRRDLGHYVPCKALPSYYHNVVKSVDPNNLEDAIDSSLSSSQDEEGHVVVFEAGNMVLHRIKVKGDWYLKMFKLKNNCTLAAVGAMVEPDEEWSEFKVRCEIPEELVEQYREFFNEFQEYVSRVNSYTSTVTLTSKMANHLKSRREYVEHFKTNRFFHAYMTAYDKKGKLAVAERVAKALGEPYKQAASDAVRIIREDPRFH